MREPIFGAQYSHAEQLNGYEGGLFEIILRVQNRESLLKACSPSRELMFLVNIASELQEPPKDIG